MTWRTIDSAPSGKKLLLYYPPTTGRNALAEMYRVDFANSTPFRHESHWQPLPVPPGAEGVSDE